MKYIKLQNNLVVEAPYMIERDNKKIIGYNKEANEKMLLEDGYLKYTGYLNISNLNIVDGKIVEIPQISEEIPPSGQTEFSKLQIRRTARALGKQDFLNNLLKSNENFYNDWNDAQIIDLNDQMFTNLSGFAEVQEFINEIKANI